MLGYLKIGGTRYRVPSDLSLRLVLVLCYVQSKEWYMKQVLRRIKHASFFVSLYERLI